jgi:hypothetical protein
MSAWMLTGRYARLVLRLPDSGDELGLKARTWHDRFVIRDIIDLHAVSITFSYVDL